MDGIGQYNAQSCAEISEKIRKNLCEREFETHPPSNHASVSQNTGDVFNKMAQNDYLRIINRYRNEALAKAEKEMAHDTEDTEIDSSPPMSLEEMDCERISPIQAKDVYSLIDGSDRTALGPQRNMGAKKNDFEEILKLNPSEGLMKYPAGQFLWSNTSCSHDHSTAHNILGKYETHTSHCQDECTTMKGGDSGNSKVTCNARISSEMVNQDYRELTEQNSCNISLNKGIKCTPFSNHFSEYDMLNIAVPEKQVVHDTSSQSMIHLLQNDAEVDISNQSRDTRSERVMFSDRDLQITMTEGLSYVRSATACRGENLLGLSWKIEKEKIVSRDYLKSFHCQGEPMTKTDHMSQGLWNNVKKVHLPDSSAYIKSLENQEPKFLSLLFNQTENSVSGNLQKHDSHQFNPTANLRSENVHIMEKMFRSRRAEDGSNQAITTPSIEGLPSQNRLLELPLKKQDVGSNLKTFGSETDKESEYNSWENQKCVIQSSRNKQIQEKELTDEIKMKTEVKFNLGGEYISGGSPQYRLPGELETVAVEEPLMQILPGMQHEKEEWNVTKDHGLHSPDKEITEGCDELDCENEKAEGAGKPVVGGELNISQKKERKMEGSDEIDISEEESTFGKEIDRLMDDTKTKREAELLVGQNLYVKGTEHIFMKSFGEKRDELVKTADEVCSQKGVMEENTQYSLSVEENNGINSEKSVESLVSHLEVIEKDCEKIRGVKKAMVEIQLMDKEGANNAETAKVFMKNVVIPDEIGKCIDSENGEVRNVVTGSQMEKVQTLRYDVNEQLLRDIELSFKNDEIERRKSQTLDAYGEAEYKAKDVSQPINLDGGCLNLEDSLVSVSFNTGSNIESEDVMKDDSDSMEGKENEVCAGICTYESKVRDEISERANEPNLVVVMGEENLPINSGGPDGENRPTAGMPKKNVEADSKEKTFLKDGIIKKWNANNCGDRIEVDGGNLNELSLNSTSMENDEEVDKKDLNRLIGEKKVPTNGKSKITEKENFISLILNKSIADEYATSKGENIGNFALERQSFCHTVGTFNTRSNNLVGNREDASHTGNDSEVTMNMINETIDERKDENWKSTIFEIPKHDNNIPNLEDEHFGSKAKCIGVEDIVLNNCLGGVDCSANENFQCNAKTSPVQAHITSLLPTDCDISKPTNLSEVRNKECTGKLLTLLPMSPQPDDLCVEICKLEENVVPDGNKSLCYDSSMNGSCDMKAALSNCEHEDDKKIEIHDTVQQEKDVVAEQLDLSAGKFTLKEPKELDKTMVLEILKDVVKYEGRWCVSQKGKNYMISGVELTRNDCECLNSGIEIVTSLDGDSCRVNSVYATKDIGENLNLKPPSEFLSIEFGEMGKSPDLQPNSLILDASNGEDGLDLNIAPNMESFGKDEYKKLALDNTVKNQTTFRSSPPILNGLPIFSFSEVSNSDNDEIEKQNSVAIELPALPPLSIDCNEEKYVSSILKYRTPYKDFDTGDSFSKPSNFINLNVSIADEMCESNSGRNNPSEKNVSESGPNDEYEKTDFEHDNALDLKSSEPLVDGVFAVPEEIIENEINRGSPRGLLPEFQSILMIKETNDDHQIVLDGIDTQNSKALELDCVPSENRKLFTEATGKTMNETNRNISNIVDTESDSFSLDSYLDTIVDKQLSSENKGDYISSTSFHVVTQFANTGCQTQHSGPLNIFHSCECLETYFLPGGELGNLQFGGRKRALQALNLDSLDFRNKKFKMLDETIPIDDIHSKSIFVKDDVSSKTEFSFDHQHSTTGINHETTLITENIIHGFGNEPKPKESSQVLKLPENDWDELDGLDEGIKRKEVADQKVPDVELHQDCLAGLEGKSQKMSDIIQDTNPKSLPALRNIYHGSKVLRLGLSKRAKLPRLHHQK